jgi:hypothetical protein
MHAASPSLQSGNRSRKQEQEFLPCTCMLLLLLNQETGAESRSRNFAYLLLHAASAPD